jgi:hypothetical protein
MKERIRITCEENFGKDRMAGCFAESAKLSLPLSTVETVTAGVSCGGARPAGAAWMFATSAGPTRVWGQARLIRDSQRPHIGFADWRTSVIGLWLKNSQRIA